MRRHPSLSCPAHHTTEAVPFPPPFAQYVSARRSLLLCPRAARAVRTDRKRDRTVGVAEKPEQSETRRGEEAAQLRKIG